MSAPTERPSKSQTRKAGDALRRQLREPGQDVDSVRTDPANAQYWQVVEQFQRAHVLPTEAYVSVLAGALSDLGISPPTYRIKRAERIIEKIARSSTGLERLQDIGGCRVVVPEIATQREVVTRVVGLDFEVVEVDDYVAPEGRSAFDRRGGAGPKGSGYRAIHIVHRIDGVLVETQVRTETQHTWAAAAERAEQMTGYPMKFGDAPADLIDYFRVASQLFALQESDQPADRDLMRQLVELRERIRAYYRGNR